MELSFSDIQRAQKRLAPLVKKTRLARSPHFSQKLGLNLFLKWETEQEIKSFKIRGALNKILSLTEEEKARGLISASAGNHAQGVALSASLLKIKARVVMMESASKVKAEAVKKLGAEVILKGKSYDESYHYAQSIKGDSIFIHPFADPQIIAGQGTAGMDIFKDLPEIHSVAVSVGGGGLLAGVSLALKTLKPSVKIYGAVWDKTSGFCKSFNKLKGGDCSACPENLPPQPSKSGLTDGIAVQKSSPRMVQLSAPYVDGIACVSEEDISKCLVELKLKEGSAVEGSGVAGLAGLLKYSDRWDLGKNCCAIISGANIDRAVLSGLVEKYGKAAVP